MEIDATSDDGSLAKAVSAITAKMQGGDESARIDTRENREDADVTELEESTDLDEAEREEREAKANEAAKAAAKNGKAPAEVEGKDAKEGEAEDEAQFIELPAAEEGGEPQRIPVKEAVEAVQKLRQMDGEIATAVIRAEEEAFQKQDRVTQELASTFEKVVKQADIAIDMMRAYAPREPDPRDYNSTEHFYQAKLDYDAYAAHYHKVVATREQAKKGIEATGGQQESELVRRETERTARFIPGWADPKTRAEKQQEIVNVLGPKYGVKMEDVSEITDHRALRIIHDLTQSLKQAKAAPEVRKQIQEKAPKLRDGRVTPDRDGQGRFLPEARKELREKGTEDAFVKMLMRSNALKGI